VQDPTALLKAPEHWNALKAALTDVLAELSRSPATVAAVRTTGAAGGGGSSAAAGSNGAVPTQQWQASAAAGAAAAAAAAAAGSSAQRYLSSYKLFGLQLADSAFRRGFLVQV
jgi:hypothetical protein